MSRSRSSQLSVSSFLLLSLAACLGLLALACDGGTEGDDGLPVGSACTQDAQCAGPGTPECLTAGLYPLTELADSTNPTAQGLAGVGVPLPAGYCSSEPPCATDADCGEGGTCFFPLRDVDEEYFTGLVEAMALPAEDAEVLLGFLEYGQCLQACDSGADCARDGYVCATPLADFLGMVTGADLSTFCIGEAPACDPACAHGTCDLEASPPACECQAGWEGAACDQNIDDCDPNPCQNGGTCQDGVATYTCTCPTGYTGTNCETAVEDCTGNPCVHGTCQDLDPGYQCTCEAGWEGPNCDTDIDECSPNPCQNGGTCQDGVATYTCTCPTGTTGTNCEIQSQGCADDPCVHGTCEDTGPGAYTCTCEAGWTGVNCDQDIDDCSPNPCQNGGTCQDQVAGFACDCATAPGWQGALCDEDEPDCLPNPCAFGTCQEGDPGSGEFTCQCEPGWDGELCDHNIDDCDPNPCQNGGTCQDGVDEFSCSCPAGFTGPTCETAVQGCQDNPCVHGTCEDTGPGTYLCTCDAGWGGVNCDLNLDDCDPDPCQHGGTCFDDVGGFTCDCATAPGWMGELCDLDIPDCAAEPCVHGLCLEGAPGTGEFTCECEAGWAGALCDLDEPDCAADPCVNGDCIEGAPGTGEFTCACLPGWQGALCDEDEPDCAADPCVHGTCLEGAPGTGEFSCQCDPGWEGPLCDVDHDDCSPNPCQNGGTCLDELGGYTCDCPPGTSGENCEIVQTTQCVLTYTLTAGNGNNGSSWTGCNLRIRDTFMGLGDGTHGVGPGTLILRVPSDGGQNPAAGVAEVLYYHLPQSFTQDTFGTVITTDVDAAAPELGQTDNTTALATGTLALGGTPAITWGACTYPAGYNDSNTSFTPDVVGTGAGCLAPYRSTGNVNCDGSFCSQGGLVEGDNPQDETWEQAMLGITFGDAGLSTLRMGSGSTLMLVPNRSPSRTYLSWEGTLQGTPVCQ